VDCTNSVGPHTKLPPTSRYSCCLSLCHCISC